MNEAETRAEYIDPAPKASFNKSPIRHGIDLRPRGRPKKTKNTHRKGS